ncbi:MAG: hypothetical protein HC826_00575 [Rhodospirillales bacterium]|nr:hypothetical protein [Rhodospirillales bacterium]
MLAGVTMKVADATPPNRRERQNGAAARSQPADDDVDRHRRFGCLSVTAAGCGLTDAHVYRWDEFNREGARFNTPLREGEPVSICFNALETTDLQVKELADTECATLGKVAEWADDRFGICPLLTPNESVFTCRDALPAGMEAPGVLLPRDVEQTP